jgi:hypothetical protein
MRLMFVYWAFEDQGSGLLIQGYTRAARELGHEVVVYGRPNPRIPLNYSLNVGSADAVLFIFEWTTKLMQGDSLDWVRLMSKVPRRRRVILDGDGNYNDMVQAGGDYNHRDAAGARKWTEICDSLTDKICQPTLHPLRPHVRTFLFYCYDPAWEVPLDFRAKEYSMIYVGHSKFRWGPMARVLRAIEPVHEQVGRLGVVGHGWGELPPWAAPMKMEDAYYTDPSYMNELGVEILPPIPFGQVVACMSKATFNPVISRPTFNLMRLVTPRYFETPAASTIPLFGLDAAYVQEIYGERALELMLPAEKPEDKIADLLRRPGYYGEIVQDIRRHMREEHSQTARLKELIEIIES